MLLPIRTGYEELMLDVDEVWIYGIAFAEKRCRMKGKKMNADRFRHLSQPQTGIASCGNTIDLCKWFSIIKISKVSGNDSYKRKRFLQGAILTKGGDHYEEKTTSKSAGALYGCGHDRPGGVSRRNEGYPPAGGMTRSAGREHVLNKENNWQLWDVLLMPGERIYTEEEYTTSTGWCICMQAGWTDVPWINYNHHNAGLHMGWPPDPHNPNASPHKPNDVDTDCLISSSASASGMTPIPKTYNDFNIAGGFLSHSEDAELNARNAKYISEYKGCSINTGYINNTGLPVIFETRGGASQCGYDPYADVEVVSYAGHEHYPATVHYTANCCATLTFLEPYYEFDYKTNGSRWGWNIEFTEEELAMIKESCEGFYVQPETQEITLPQLPLRPGLIHGGWSSSQLFVQGSERIEDGKYIYTINEDSIITAAMIHDEGEDPINQLTAMYGECDTVTFNPNGGELPEGTETLREYGNRNSEKFFNINSVVPVREGYTFAGWAFEPHPTEEDAISEYSAKEGSWYHNWRKYYDQNKPATSTSRYDIQLFAVWEGEYVSDVEDPDTGVTIALTDGVPTGATLSADTIATESVLESRPELKEQLTDLQSVYQMDILVDGQVLEVKDNPMTVRIPMNDQLRGYDYYQVVYLGDELERIDAEGRYNECLEFQTDHLGQFAVIGTNTPFTRQVLFDIYLENVTLQDAGMAGKAPAFTAAVKDEDKHRYAVVLEQWSGSDGKAITSSEAFNETIPEEQRLTVFEEGVTYTYSVRVEAKTNYVFRNSATLALNGDHCWDIKAEDLGLGEDFAEGDSDWYCVSGTFKNVYEVLCVPAVKELADSDTSVSISLTGGVPEGATLYADTMATESVFDVRPELEEELPGLLSVYQISVRKDGESLEVKDDPMTIKIPLNGHLKGYKYYQAVYLGEELERKDATVEGDFLVFQTDHLSEYAILGSNSPFGEDGKPETVKKGDVDADGKVSVQDLRLLLRHVCGKTKLEGNALKAADLVGNDGKADIQDLRFLLRVICGKVTLE